MWRTIAVLFAIGLVVAAACSGDDDRRVPSAASPPAAPPATETEATNAASDATPSNPALLPVEQVLSAEQAGFSTAAAALMTVNDQELAGLLVCGEFEEAAIAAEGSVPHGLTPADPIPDALLDFFAAERPNVDLADYEVRVLTETGIVFLSRDRLTLGSRRFEAGAIHVQQFLFRTQPERRVGWAVVETGLLYTENCG